MEWSLPHSRWVRSRTWLVGKTRPETVDVVDDQEGQFGDVEGDHKGEGDTTDKGEEESTECNQDAVVILMHHTKDSNRDY